MIDLMGIRLEISPLMPPLETLQIGPSRIVCGIWAYRAIKREVAANVARAAFAGRNWRRIKREVRKARERVR